VGMSVPQRSWGANDLAVVEAEARQDFQAHGHALF
jgi:hypothetical protein